MKTKLILGIGVIAIIIGVIACSKEKPTYNDNKQTAFEYDLKSQIPYSKITVRNKGYKGSKGSTQVLVFKDMASVNQTIDDLYRQVNEWNQAFVEKYKDLNEEDRNMLEEELGFDEQQPLIDFNKFYDFFSLYQKVSEDEKTWLQQTDPDFSTNPDNHFVFQYSTRTILNTDCEVQVGDTLYKLTEDGYFAISNKSMQTLAILSTNPTNYQYIPYVIFVGDENEKAENCNSNKRKEGWLVNPNNDKCKINWVVSHWSHPWNRRCAAKIDNYKKSGSWKKYSTYCLARTYGFISSVDGSGNANCDKQFNFNPNNISESTTAKHVEHFISVQTKTKTGWIQSYFYGASGATCTKTLTW